MALARETACRIDSKLKRQSCERQYRDQGCIAPQWIFNLKGLDGFNDNAYTRRVVVHGAWYMNPSFIKQSGRAGRSWGCPAIAHVIAKPLINAIKNGSVIFAYYPDRNYQRHSVYGVA